MNLRNLWIGLTAALLWSSCQSLYLPNTPNVPLMSDGDELQVGVNLGSNGYGAQLAYSPYYHWTIAATGNTFTMLDGNGRNPDNITFKHMNGEAATGYYTRLNKWLRTEALVGYGAGWTGVPLDNKQLYRKFFFQPSFGISSPYFDAGITPRLTYLQHHKEVIAGATSKLDESAMFMEPTLTLRAGMDEFKFQMQGGFAFALGDAPFSYRNRFLTFGIHLTFVKDFDKYR